MSRVRQALLLYLAVFIGLWIVALSVVLVQGQLLHKPYPYNTLLFYPNIHFTDFTIFDPRFAAWDHTDRFFALPGFPFTYPAPLLACFLAYWKFTSHPLSAYLATVGFFALVGAALLGARRPEIRFPVAFTLVGAYPLMFLLDRANIEGLVWIPMVLGTLAFTRRRYTSAALLFGLATGMKIFPGALLLLFLARRRYREFALSLATALTANLAALAIAGPSIPRALRGVLSGMDFFRHFEILTYRSDQIGFEHSLFSCLKQALHLIFRGAHRTDQMLPSVCLPYLIVVGLAFAAYYGLRLRHLPVLNQLFGLTACSILLPFISYDYTLVHMFIPFAALLIFLTTDVARGRVAFSRRKALAFLVPCAILFAPLSWILIRSAGYGGQFKAIALVALAGAAAWIPMPSSLFGDLSATRIESLPVSHFVILKNDRVHGLS